MKDFRWLKFLEMMFLIAAIALVIWSMSGCASQATGTRIVHVVEKKQTFVVAQEQVIPVTEITEKWTDEKSETKTTVAPDMPRIIETGIQIASIATPGISPKWIEAGLALISGTTTAWAVKKHSEVNSKDEQIRFHKQDATDGWEKAERHALARTPPLQV